MVKPRVKVRQVGREAFWRSRCPRDNSLSQAFLLFGGFSLCSQGAAGVHSGEWLVGLLWGKLRPNPGGPSVPAKGLFFLKGWGSHRTSRKSFRQIFTLKWSLCVENSFGKIELASVWWMMKGNEVGLKMGKGVLSLSRNRDRNLRIV